MRDTKRFPFIRDATCDSRSTRLHCEIDVTWAEGMPPQRFCGDNWCHGECGHPALIIHWESMPEIGAVDRFAKASGSQVACGPLMQQKRVAWSGRRVEVPEEHRKDFERRMWW